MIRGITAGAAALLLSACASVQSVPSNPPPPSLDAVETALARDITTLSDDGFGGRFPGSEGEAKTRSWLIDRYSDIGLQPGVGEGDWTQDFTLVRRAPLGKPGESTATITRGTRSVSLSQGLIAVQPGEDEARLADVPIVGLDPDLKELQPRSLVNRALALPASSLFKLFPQFEAAGPKVLLIMTADEEEYQKTAAMISRGRWRLASDTSGPAVMLLTPQDSEQLMDVVGQNASRHPDGLGVIAYDTILKASIAQQVDRIETANVIGRMPGKVPGAGAVLVLAHWDHLGDACGPADAKDRLCNGAVDNASGLAVMIEAVRIALRDGPLDRDVIVLATSSEELGLLGAKAFVADPPVPPDKALGLPPAGAVADDCGGLQSRYHGDRAARHAGRGSGGGQDAARLRDIGGCAGAGPRGRAFRHAGCLPSPAGRVDIAARRGAHGSGQQRAGGHGGIRKLHAGPVSSRQ